MALHIKENHTGMFYSATPESCAVTLSNHPECAAEWLSEYRAGMTLTMLQKDFPACDWSIVEVKPQPVEG